MRYPILFSEKNCKYDLYEEPYYEGLRLEKYDYQYGPTVCGKKNIVTNKIIAS